ncbi:hypothetical protein BDV26DRAFT_261684 [Aspergillus bertholletiae]|uniref:S-adenosyl-L-methionine-dependent methyltransferase n=1 Tax=Aspergillus bertholletiae TaxID=1226010 RepID=A0A5N7B9J4_9EURO|nr:hypothetical protein BDV26DRAFT_261684 [Aspergillus bertholletiae]
MSKEEIIEAKAKALHDHISSRPVDTYADKPWGLVKSTNESADESRMMTFKDAEIEDSRQQTENIQPAPKTIVEFGGYVGASAITWDAILREFNNADSSVDANVYTFELSSVSAGIAQDPTRLCDLENTAHVFEGPAADPPRKVFEEGNLKKTGVDIAFFDHWE